jgi:hypothetical protein
VGSNPTLAANPPDRAWLNGRTSSPNCAHTGDAIPAPLKEGEAAEAAPFVARGQDRVLPQQRPPPPTGPRRGDEITEPGADRPLPGGAVSPQARTARAPPIRRRVNVGPCAAAARCPGAASMAHAATRSSRGDWATEDPGRTQHSTLAAQVLWHTLDLCSDSPRTVIFLNS